MQHWGPRYGMRERWTPGNGACRDLLGPRALQPDGSISYDPSVDEREPELEEKMPAELLEEWREAERDADHETPGSSAEEMARKRAAGARDAYHDGEDEERDRQGNHLPRRRADDSG